MDDRAVRGGEVAVAFSDAPTANVEVTTVPLHEGF
jgi:hypothetical protein